MEPECTDNITPIIVSGAHSLFAVDVCVHHEYDFNNELIQFLTLRNKGLKLVATLNSVTVDEQIIN